MDLSNILLYAKVYCEACESGRPHQDDRAWLREGYKAVSARLDLDSLEYECKQQRRLPHMIKSLFGGENMARLREMVRAYMKGKDTGVKEQREKPQGDGTVLTTFMLGLDQREPTPEELAAAERQRARVSAQAKAIMETLADPAGNRGRCKTRWGQYGQLKDK